MKLTREMIENLGPSLYRFCLSLTRKKEEAEDLYQETFLTFLNYKKPLEEETAKSLLFKMAQRQWMDKKRKWARRQRIAPEVSGDQVLDLLVDSAQGPEGQLEEKEGRRALNREILALDEDLRSVLLLYYLGEIKIREIGDLLGIPEGTVKSRLYQAKKKLKERLDDEGK